VIGEFTYQLAVETPNGANRVFNAPSPWAPGTLYVTRNGLVLSRGFSFIGGTQIQFDEVPQIGDVIGFLYNFS